MHKKELVVKPKDGFSEKQYADSLIGTGGDMVKFIKSETGATISIQGKGTSGDDGTSNSLKVVVTHKTNVNSVTKALVLVSKLIEEIGVTGHMKLTKFKKIIAQSDVLSNGSGQSSVRSPNVAGGQSSARPSNLAGAVQFDILSNAGGQNVAGGQSSAIPSNLVDVQSSVRSPNVAGGRSSEHSLNDVDVQSSAIPSNLVGGQSSVRSPNVAGQSSAIPSSVKFTGVSKRRNDDLVLPNGKRKKNSCVTFDRPSNEAIENLFNNTGDSVQKSLNEQCNLAAYKLHGLEVSSLIVPKDAYFYNKVISVKTQSDLLTNTISISRKSVLSSKDDSLSEYVSNLTGKEKDIFNEAIESHNGFAVKWSDHIYAKDKVHYQINSSYGLYWQDDEEDLSFEEKLRRVFYIGLTSNPYCRYKQHYLNTFKKVPGKFLRMFIISSFHSPNSVEGLMFSLRSEFVLHTLRNILSTEFTGKPGITEPSLNAYAYCTITKEFAAETIKDFFNAIKHGSPITERNSKLIDHQIGSIYHVNRGHFTHPFGLTDVEKESSNENSDFPTVGNNQDVQPEENSEQDKDSRRKKRGEGIRQIKKAEDEKKQRALKQMAGDNMNVPFDLNELEKDFDPEEHDRMMKRPEESFNENSDVPTTESPIKSTADELKDGCKKNANGKFTCPVCKEDFSNKWYMLGPHMRLHNEAEKSYKCSVCGRTFNDHSKCRSHEAVCTSMPETDNAEDTNEEIQPSGDETAIMEHDEERSEEDECLSDENETNRIPPRRIVGYSGHPIVDYPGELTKEIVRSILVEHNYPSTVITRFFSTIKNSDKHCIMCNNPYEPSFRYPKICSDELCQRFRCPKCLVGRKRQGLNMPCRSCENATRRRPRT